MSPYQPGEVYVTDDGAETASTWAIRALHAPRGSRESNITTGKVYANVTPGARGTTGRTARLSRT